MASKIASRVFDAAQTTASPAEPISRVCLVSVSLKLFIPYSRLQRRLSKNRILLLFRGSRNAAEGRLGAVLEQDVPFVLAEIGNQDSQFVFARRC
jgi:hypothetical protein